MGDYRPCGPHLHAFLPSFRPPCRGLFVRVPESSPDLKTGPRAVPSVMAAARDGARPAHAVPGPGTDGGGPAKKEKPAGPYTVELFARDLADLLDHVGWSSALVAGASMGGCIALAFAAASPAGPGALGLIAPTAWYGAEAPGQWAERATKAAKEGMAGLVEFQTTRWFGD